MRLLCRRAEPTVVQPYRWLTFAGFIRHLHEMPDEWRWRFMARVLGMREGFAQDHYDRVRAFPNFSLETGSAVTGARGGRPRGAGNAAGRGARRLRHMRLRDPHGPGAGA